MMGFCTGWFGLAVGTVPALMAMASEGPLQVSVAVDAGQVVRTFDPTRLGGTNVAAWTSADAYASPAIRQRFEDLHAALVRLPGGSWANVMYWNGHGVRGADGKVEASKVGPDGYPAVDYSDYAPSFMVESNLHPRSDGWHGNIDVKGLHEFIAAVGSSPLACPNLGTGRAVDAAEWVKWANKKMGYSARYWEIGNELGGGWEAGTVLPDGKTRMTGPMYARRYKEMATAMKAVDPTIKIGGGAFAEDMLREGGDTVDFVMSHLYPGNPIYSDEQQFTRVKAVSESAAELKGWIRKYQPERAGQIELAITEWGMPDYRGMRDSINGLWSSLFLREAAVSGFDFATQWQWEDMFEFARKSEDKDQVDFYAPNHPWSQYWALWMWNHYVGNQLVKSEQVAAGAVHSLATRTADAVQVQLVNTDHEREAAVLIHLSGFEPASAGEMATFSTREYSWDYVAHKVQWSNPPAVTSVNVGPETVVTMPPFSVVYVRIPAKNSTTPAPWAQSSTPTTAAPNQQVALKISLPSEVYVGDRIEGAVRAVSADTQMPVSAPDAQLQTTGGQADRAAVRLKEAAGRFFVTTEKPGPVQVTARLGDQSVSFELTAKPSIPQPHIYWLFQEPKLTGEEGYTSDWSLISDDTVRPNQRVVRVDLDNVTPDGQHRALMRLDRLPKDDVLNRANIRGVLFDLMVSPDFTCADPNANVMVVMQSPANYWMVMGSVPLAQARQWQTYKLMTQDPKLIEAMPYVHNVHFMVNSKSPIRGSIFFDRAGFMVR